MQKAGLTVEERDFIANAYDTGIILVCVATCSLAAGINLYSDISYYTRTRLKSLTCWRI